MRLAKLGVSDKMTSFVTTFGYIKFFYIIL